MSTIQDVAASVISVKDTYGSWARLDNTSGSMTNEERDRPVNPGENFTYVLSERSLHPHTTLTAKNCLGMYVTSLDGHSFQPTSVIKGDSTQYIPQSARDELGRDSKKYTLISINKTDFGEADKKSANGDGFGQIRLRFGYTG